MSSATRTNMDDSRNLQSALAPGVMGKIARLGLSPRQQELNRLWAAYRGQQYAARRIDWDGSQRYTPLESEVIASGSFIPPGFYDAGATMPLRFRRPSAPYHLRKVIVDRFTGLLFSDRKHPAIRVDDDPRTQDYVRALCEVSRLWPKMIMARTYGGAMGAVAVGFAFLEGKPMVEVHDPRWLYPEFADRDDLRLAKIEKRYQFPVDEQDPETGEWIQRAYWYRRLIDDVRDVVFKPVPVDEESPAWEVEREVEHGFGFCPVVWAQNLPVQDDIDGDPDCQGIEEMCEQIDALLSQAAMGTIGNSDPTLRIITDAELPDLRKGTGNAIKLPAGSSMDYMELSGTGPKAAVELADKLRMLALEVAQCVLDQTQGAGVRTATEVDKVYASMIAKADVLREQYGERLVKPLIEMMVRAIRIIEQPRLVDGALVRRVVRLPDQVTRREDGTIERAARSLGDGGALNLSWGPYFDPSLDDLQKATTATATAMAAGLLDKEHAIGFVAPYYLVEDAAGMAKKIEREAAAEQGRLDDAMMAELGEEPAAPVAEVVDAMREEAPLDVDAADRVRASKLADEALNGAQVSSMVEIIKAVGAGEIPRATGVMILSTAFNLSIDTAGTIMGEVGRSFESPAPVAGEE